MGLKGEGSLKELQWFWLELDREAEWRAGISRGLLSRMNMKLNDYSWLPLLSSRPKPPLSLAYVIIIIFNLSASVLFPQIPFSPPPPRSVINTAAREILLNVTLYCSSAPNSPVTSYLTQHETKCPTSFFVSACVTCVTKSLTSCSSVFLVVLWT